MMKDKRHSCIYLLSLVLVMMLGCNSSNKDSQDQANTGLDTSITDDLTAEGKANIDIAQSVITLAAKASDGAVTLLWAAIEGAVVYDIEHAVEGAVIANTQTEGLQITVNELTAIPHEFSVKAIDEAGNVVAASATITVVPVQVVKPARLDTAP